MSTSTTDVAFTPSVKTLQERRATGTCTQAGMLTTLAVLAGKDAERFLEAELVPHWVIRH